MPQQGPLQWPDGEGWLILQGGGDWRRGETDVVDTQLLSLANLDRPMVVLLADGLRAEADDLLEQIIAAHSVPKSLAVVSSDHRVQTAAKRRGAVSFDSQPWLDDLIDGKVKLAVAVTGRAGEGGEAKTDKPKSVNDDDVQQWLRDFGF